MKNNLPNVWLDEIDIEECRGTEYHWCSHNQKDTFNICYVPKEKLDIAVSALKEISAHVDDWGNGCSSLTNAAKIAIMALKDIGE